MVMPEEPPENAPASDNLQLVKIPDSPVQAVESDREGNLPVVPEKPSEDGYNWRKYGQKNVKGNEFIRSYYKCSYPNCQVKKQVERTHDGRITDTSYFGVHEHPKAHSSPRAAVPALLSVQVQIPDCPPLPATEENSSDAHKTASHNVEPKITREVSTPAAGDHGMHTPRLPSSEPRDDVDNSENLITKRRKKGNDNAETIGDKTGSESRVVVHTVSEVDIVNDGHRWRKYGQKMVKGNPHPRSYYRCSTTGCPAKKHVERASYDQKVVITTYEGQHDHSTPPLRTIHSISPLKTVLPESAPVTAASSPNAIDKSKSVKSDAAQNGRTTSKPEEDTSDHKPKEDSDTMTGVETKVKVVTLTEQQQTSSETEWDLPPAVETKPDPPPEVETKPGPPPEVETKHEACPASSASETKQHEQQCPDSVFTSSCPETNPNGQHKVDSAEPVNC